MERRGGLRVEEITISWGTLAKVFIAALLGLAFFKLARFLEVVGLSILISIALRPIFLGVQRHKWPKWAAVALCAVILFGGLTIIFGILVPPLIKEGGEFVKQLPQYKDSLLQRLPPSGPVRDALNRMLSGSKFSNPGPMLEKVIAWGGSGLEVLAGFLAMLVLAVYFVSDGSRVYKWLAAFLPRDKRQQLDNSTGEITSVVSRYVGGSALTAMICGVYAFTVLSILRVPNAALLAVVAAFFDLLPIIGFFIFAFPSVLVALTVSGKTAILVFVLYGAYHLTEAYFIVPKIYGNRLRLSGLTVLLCCLCAGLVGGVVAILLVLPLAACYPIAERIWLKAYLEPETVQKHERMEARANPKPHLNN